MSSQLLVSSETTLLRKTAVARRRRNWSKITATYLLLLPGLVYLFFNNYLPMVGIVMAFKRVDFRLGIFGSPWNGLENFRFLFASGDAWIITRNTILYNVAFIVLGIVVGVSLAILMFELHEQKIARVYQTLILLPMLMSWVVVSYLVFALLSTETGFINKTILPLLGVNQPISFYQEPKYWPFILVLANMWKGIGFSMIVYLSSILSINPEYFDAAKVDGASKWQQIRHITLPSLKPVVIILVILSMSRMFYSDFGLFYQLPRNSGLLYDVTQTIDVYVYNALMTQNNFGMSAAAGLYQSIVGFVLVIAANAVIKKISPEHALF